MKSKISQLLFKREVVFIFAIIVIFTAFEFLGEFPSASISLTSNTVKCIAFLCFIFYHIFILKKAIMLYRNRFYLNLHSAFIYIAGFNAVLLLVAANVSLEVHSMPVINYVYTGFPINFYYNLRVLKPFFNELKTYGIKFESIEAEQKYGMNKSTVAFSFAYFISSSCATLFTLIPKKISENQGWMSTRKRWMRSLPLSAT